MNRCLLYFIVLLTAIPSAAPIGDFAPLKKGNMWVYQQLITSRSVTGVTSKSLSEITLVIEDSKIVGDTIFYLNRTIV